MDSSSKKKPALQDHELTPLSCPHCKIDFGMISTEQFNTHLKSCTMAPSNQGFLNTVLATPITSNTPGKKNTVSNPSLPKGLDSGKSKSVPEKADEDGGEIPSIDLPCSYDLDSVMAGLEFSADPHEVARGRYKTLTDPQLFVNALENPKTHSLSSLRQITSNACNTLVTWQNEYRTVVRKLALAETSIAATQPYIPKRDPHNLGSLEIDNVNGDVESSTPRRRASPKKRVLQPVKESIPRATRKPRASQVTKKIDTDTGASRTPSVAAPKARPGRKRKSDGLPAQPPTRKRTKLNISHDVGRAPSVNSPKDSSITVSIAPVPAAPKVPPKSTPKSRLRKRKSSETDATIELAVETPPPQRKRVRVEDLPVAPSASAATVAEAPKKKGRPFKKKPPVSLPPLASLLSAPAETSTSISTTTTAQPVRSARQTNTPTKPAPRIPSNSAKATINSVQQPAKVPASTPKTPILPPPAPHRPRTTPILPTTIDISSLPAGAPSTPLDLTHLPSGAAQPPSLLISLYLGPSAAFSKLAATHSTSPPPSVPTSTSSSLPTITLATSPSSDKIVLKTEKGGKSRKVHLDIDPLTGKNKTRSDAMLGVWAARKARGTNGRHGGKPVKGN